MENQVSSMPSDPRNELSKNFDGNFVKSLKSNMLSVKYQKENISESSGSKVKIMNAQDNDQTFEASMTMSEEMLNSLNYIRQSILSVTSTANVKSINSENISVAISAQKIQAKTCIETALLNPNKRYDVKEADISSNEEDNDNKVKMIKVGDITKGMGTSPRVTKIPDQPKHVKGMSRHKSLGIFKKLDIKGEISQADFAMPVSLKTSSGIFISPISQSTIKRKSNYFCQESQNRRSSNFYGSNLFEIAKPNFSRAYLNSHPSKFIRIKNYVNQNLPKSTRENLE